jgi:hypothetical protein
MAGPDRYALENHVCARFRVDGLRASYADTVARGQVPSVRAAILCQGHGVLADVEGMPSLWAAEICRRECNTRAQQRSVSVIDAIFH